MKVGGRESGAEGVTEEKAWWQNITGVPKDQPVFRLVGKSGVR